MTEPTDLGASAGLASEADRAQVISLLSAALASGLLTSDEHRRRVRLARDARTFDDLVPLTSDLQQPAAKRYVGVFATSGREGAWVVPANLTALSAFGNVRLDFTHATWATDSCDLTVGALFGSVDVIVGDDVAVRDSTLSLFGGSDGSHDGADAIHTLHIRGLCGFGGVTVRVTRA